MFYRSRRLDLLIHFLYKHNRLKQTKFPNCCQDSQNAGTNTVNPSYHYTTSGKQIYFHSCIPPAIMKQVSDLIT